MATDSKAPLCILVIVMPNFNLAATVGFIDPFRAANYLEGRTHFRWGVDLETALPIPQICQSIGISQRQLDRLFLRFVRQSPALYYRDIRLDRARGLVTQTELPLAEAAVASGRREAKKVKK